MNFPATGGISDDAQFFFEDYNFYYNATVNAAAAAAAASAVSVPPPLQTNGHHSMPNHESNGNGDLAFSTLISTAITGHQQQDRNNNHTGYAPAYEGTPILQHDVHTPSRQRNASGSTVATSVEDKKSSKNGQKSSSNKICRVCGDKALGYNFNVVTCESCKAFFRRNALKKKKLQCPFQNRCTVTVSSRRYCQKCRLRKCFEVGMKAEYIMTEEQRAQKRQRLLERESMENGVMTPTSMHQDDMFLTYDNPEVSNRYDSISSMQDMKPILPSSKSSSGSSEYHPENQSNIHSPIDVAAWVNEIPAQQQMILTSPSEPASLIPSVSSSMENDDDMITIRIPKSALLGILFNNNDRTQQMTALGQAVVASAGSLVTSNGAPVVVRARSDTCSCPCTCSYSQVKTQDQEPLDKESTSTIYPMDIEQMYGALTAESQMAYSGMGEHMGFTLFPIQEETTNLENPETNHLSLAALSVTDDVADTQMSLCPMGSDEIVDYTPAAVRSSASMEFDLEILSTITSAFDVDWQIPLPFPSFANFNSKYAKLDELLLANEEWNQNPRAVIPLKGTSAADISTEDFFNLIHYGLKCIIKQHKRLSGFKNLASEDQQTLIKACVREMITLRAIMKFDSKTEHVHVQYPGREYMTLELAKRIRGGVYNEFKQLIASFPEKWRRNEALMLILTALALFNPECPRIVNQQAVMAEREAYCQLLKDYLESTYGEEEANQAYHYLLENVRQLVPWVNTYSIRVVFELEPSTMEPLMVEIFDFH